MNERIKMRCDKNSANRKQEEHFYEQFFLTAILFIHLNHFYANILTINLRRPKNIPPLKNPLVLSHFQGERVYTART